MYISLWELFSGHPDNNSFMHFLRLVSNKKIFENSYNSYEQYPINLIGLLAFVAVMPWKLCPFFCTSCGNMKLANIEYASSHNH